MSRSIASSRRRRIGGCATTGRAHGKAGTRGASMSSQISQRERTETGRRSLPGAQSFIELNPEYAELARKRCEQASPLFNSVEVI